ncbi:MAG: prepilin-type N-terminal cleavage/methylation domain-containing protein [bacterium]
MIKPFYKKIKKAGFTLIELLVVITIFTIITGIVLFNQNQFNGSILLTNLAYDLSLDIRQAQTFGGGGKTDISFVTATSAPVYGIHLDQGPANNKNIILFGDYNNDGLYTSNELIEQNKITRSNVISLLQYISSSGVTTTPSVVDVSFKRPEAAAHLFVNNTTPEITYFDKIIITISNTYTNQTRKIVISKLGLIYVDK